MSDSRTKNTARNMKFGTLNQTVNILLNFVNRTLIIQVLGVEYLGINSLFADVLMMLSLADLGLNTAMVYSFYQPLAQNDQKKIAGLTKFYKKVYMFIALTVAVIGLACVPFLGYIVNLDSPIPYLELYYLFFLANTVISYLFVYKTSIINADQKNYLISKYQMWMNVAKTLLQSIFLLIISNFFIYLLIQVVATFANNLIASRKADQLYPYLKEVDHHLTKPEKKSIFENMKSMFVYKVSRVFLNGTDNVLISILVGTIAVGFYANYYLVTMAVNRFIRIFFTSASASIGNVVATESPKKRFEIFQSMQTISLIISSAATVCLYVLFNDLINVWLGSKYLLDGVILIAIVVNFYLNTVMQPIWSYRDATGLFVQMKFIMLLAAAVNIALSIPMGIFFGMSGILFASAIARLTTYFWYEPKQLFEQFLEEKVRNYYLPLILNGLFTLALMAILLPIFNRFVVDSWLELLLKAILVGFVTLLAVFVLYRKTAGYRMLFHRVKKFMPGK